MGASEDAKRLSLDCQCWLDGHFLLIPDYDPDEPEEAYPGGIEPGEYTRNEVVDMLRKNAQNPEAITFIADMLEV